jgi:hypothetical protein
VVVAPEPTIVQETASAQQDDGEATTDREFDDDPRPFADIEIEEQVARVVHLTRTRRFVGDVETTVKQVEKMSPAKLAERYEKMMKCPVKEASNG